MDFKNAITLTSDKVKFLIPIECIVNVLEVVNISYTSTGNEYKPITRIVISSADYKKLGFSLVNRYNAPDIEGLFAIEVIEEFKVVAALVTGSKAAKVLHG